ncbi:MAG: penicillin-binding transpeptidase domain-containing protein [Deltaproteobacteria bacterium]|nr:penicillin-binding transpeptidase domain-containing protein [Deltaproteobacteria bacterium]
MARPAGKSRSRDGRKKADNRVALSWMRARVAIVGVVLSLGLIALAWRAVDLQVLQHERLSEMARSQTLREVVVQNQRARIEDRNGEALALSVDVESVAVDPSKLPDLPAAARQLARALHLDPSRVEARLSKGRYFSWVKRRIPPAEARAVEALGLPGVRLVGESRRFAPHRELAAQVLGFVGIDGKGLEGLELSLDGRLRGQRASASALRDARGRRLLQDDPFDEATASVGRVTLTLDRTIQWITERALQRAVKEAEAKAGMALVMDPQTGALLAMASYPTYNPNDAGASSRDSRRNRTITDVYEPGSTFKIFTLGAALEAGLVGPRTVIDTEGGAMRLAGRTIHDSHPEKTLTVSEILSTSSNIGAAKIGAMLGPDRLLDTLESLGFGRRSGIELPGEQTGIMFQRGKIGPVELATMSFGQGPAVTPLQVVTAASVVANGGNYFRPYLVSRIETADGEVIESGPRLERRVFSEATTQALTRMMEDVARPGGTGPRAAVPGFTVAGKTGTSQKPDPLIGGYSPDARVGSFVGFVPSKAPRLTILVVIDEPQGVKYGGVVAGPAFREIAEDSLRYLGVPATEPLPAVAEAAPEPAEEAPETMTALLPMGLVAPPEGKTLVPDARGMDLLRAIDLLAERKLEPRPSGSGIVLNQNPLPGTVAGPGTPVELVLAPRG